MGMKKDQQEILGNYLSNMQIHLTAVEYYKSTPEWHYMNITSDFNRLYFFQGSGAHLRIGNKEFFPERNQLFILPAGIELSLSTIDDKVFTKYYCHFAATIGDIHLFKLLDLHHYIQVNDEAMLESKFQELSRHYKSKEVTSMLRAKAVFLEILCYFIEHNRVKKIDLPASTSIEKVTRILQYIDNHLSENMTVDELAKLVHFHPNYFIQFFKSVVGSSPIQYINKTRIEKAKHLLATTGMSVSEIAETVGSQLFYFSKAFKNYTGYSPTEFRNYMQS